MEAQIISHLSQDPILKGIINQIPFTQIDSTREVFHDLMSCIIEQQIHYRSTKNIFKKRMEEAELEILTLEHFERFEKMAFQNLKLSTKKYETLERVLTFFNDNKIDWFNLSDEEVRKVFSKIKGIGPWTVDMILMYTLERPNIFPADDYHLKLIMTQLYNLNEKSKLKAQMKDVTEIWAPYKSYGTRYLLAWKDHLKKGKK